MKKQLIFVFVIGMIAIQSIGQTITNIVNVDSTLKKTNLYSNALSFFALEFKSANDVIQMKDQETGKIIGKGIIDNRSIFKIDETPSVQIRFPFVIPLYIPNLLILNKISTGIIF